jgi:predicted dehydrogenase
MRYALAARMHTKAPVRIGALGAARITPFALLAPARDEPSVEIVGVAARDRARAERFARSHRLPEVFASYDAMLASERVDAVYVPLPNSHHFAWAKRALEAGKHVLCEKPLTANADEAEVLRDAARRAGRVLMEAFHYRYHPMAERMHALCRGGTLGRVKHVETSMCIPMPLPGNIRYRLDLAGGATMDVGAYAIHLLRTLAGEEPEVVRAEAKLASPGVDRAMRAEVRFPSGATGAITCSLFSTRLLDVGARVELSGGELRAFNFVAPQMPHALRHRRRGERTFVTERFGGPSTYACQLAAFARAVREGEAPLTGPDDSIANMKVIDAVYRAAGLEPRRP